MLALVWISQSAMYCLFNMKCRHSVPAITCPFQPLVGADLCCPLWLAAIEDKGVFLSLASSVKDTTMPNVFDFQLVSLCRWVWGGMDRKTKNNKKQTKPKLHVSGFVRQWVGNSVVFLAYPTEYNPDFRRGWQAWFLWALVLASLGALGRWVGKWVWSSALFLQHLVHMDSAFLLLSGFHHHHPPPTSALQNVSFQPCWLSVFEQSCVVGGDVQVKAAYIQTSADWRLNLSVSRLPGAYGDCPLPLLVHSLACPLFLFPLLLFLPVGSLTCTKA